MDIDCFYIVFVIYNLVILDLMNLISRGNHDGISNLRVMAVGYLPFTAGNHRVCCHF